jgi:hypothetical protein
MSGPSATPTPPLNPAEMQVLIARAGLTPNPGQVADLVLAWRQIVGLLALIPRDRPLLDDQAFVFRVPPPVAPAKSAATPRQPPSAARKTAVPAGKKAEARPGKKTPTRPGKKTPPGPAKKAAAHTRKTSTPRAPQQVATRKTVRHRR